MRSKTLEKIASKEELKILATASILTHPPRATIVKYLQREGKAYTNQICEALGMEEHLVGAHLLRLEQHGLVGGKFGYREDPNPRTERYFEVTPKVEEILNKVVEYFKD